jgi:4-hydroxybenzoyl-CoA thioesterase
MSIVFRSVHQIRFSHCDPGGIVYFPNFFDFINATVEDWFDTAVEATFEPRLMQRRLGLPVVMAQCEFYRPCHIGDKLEMELAIARLGRSTIDFQISGKVGGEERLRARQVIVMVSLENYRPVPIPAALLEKVAPYVLGAAPLPRIATGGATPPKVFQSRHQLRFSHCDPAGILYSPNTFDMINAAVEDWFGEVLGLTFADMHIRQRLGFPIVDTHCEFLKPSRIGEQLTLQLSITRLGRASLDLRIAGIVAGEERMRARHVVAMISLDTLRAVPIPPELRAKMAEYAVEVADSAARGSRSAAGA